MSGFRRVRAETPANAWKAAWKPGLSIGSCNAVHPQYLTVNSPGPWARSGTMQPATQNCPLEFAPLDAKHLQVDASEESLQSKRSVSVQRLKRLGYRDMFTSSQPCGEGDRYYGDEQSTPANASNNINAESLRTAAPPLRNSHITKNKGIEV